MNKNQVYLQSPPSFQKIAYLGKAGLSVQAPHLASPQAPLARNREALSPWGTGQVAPDKPATESWETGKQKACQHTHTVRHAAQSV